MVIALKINFELDKSCLLILANYKETLLGFGPFFFLAGISWLRRRMMS